MTSPRQRIEQSHRVVSIPKKHTKANGTALDLPGTTLATIAGAQLEPSTWLYRGLLPIGAHLVVGRPKVGKSWLLLQLAMCLGTGADFLDFEAEAAMAGLYVDPEDTDERLHRRIRTIGETPPSCIRVWTGAEFTELARRYSDSLTLISFLDRVLTERPELRFVILDTEATCNALWNGERAAKHSERIVEADYAQARQFDQLALKHKVAILLVNHTRKATGKQGSGTSDPHEQINRTNTALAGCSGSIVLTSLPDADPMDTSERRRVFAVRARDVDDDLALILEHDRKSGTFRKLGRYFEVRQAAAEVEVLKALEELYAEVAAGEWLPISELAAAASTSAQAVKNALHRMRKGNRLVWNGRRIESKKGRKGGVRLVPIVSGAATDASGTAKEET